jgi:hypothetical protein
LKKTLHKNRAGGVAQGEGPEFNPQYCKKREENFHDFCSENLVKKKHGQNNSGKFGVAAYSVTNLHCAY